MAAALDRGEIAMAQALQAHGFSRSSAVLAVVMATRAHARPQSELVEIVRQYQGLESAAEARLAIDDLLQRNWVQTSNSYGTTLTHQAPNLRELIATELRDDRVADQLLAMRANLEPHVRMLGAMKDENVYHTFMELLRSAQQEICLPMLATTPYDETVRILRERAEAGVRVRILLAVPEIVAKWRGEPMRAIAKERIDQWVKTFRDRRSVEVRVCDSQEDMEIATCVAVDNSVVRFDIYDPYTQRSLEGVMVEVISPQGIVPNVVRLFQRIFDDAWQRSISTHRLARTWRFLARWWKLWLTFIAFAISGIPTGLSHWTEILIGIGCGIGAPFILEEAPRAYKVVQKWQAS